MKRYLLMPRFAILDARVWRGIPNLSAAPDGPESRPRHSARAVSIISFSWSSRRRSSFLTDWTVEGGSHDDTFVSHVSSTDKVASSHNTTALSIIFCSSRILPGHLYPRNNVRVFLSM